MKLNNSNYFGQFDVKRGLFLPFLLSLFLLWKALASYENSLAYDSVLAVVCALLLARFGHTHSTFLAIFTHECSSVSLICYPLCIWLPTKHTDTCFPCLHPICVQKSFFVFQIGKYLEKLTFLPFSVEKCFFQFTCQFPRKVSKW